MMFHKKYILLVFFPGICLADSTQDDDPCASLLAVLNRPTASDSACVAKSGEVIIEIGYQYQNLYPENGNSSNFPEAQFRFGLPFSNEIAVLMPNYITESYDDETVTGSSATVVSLKHQFPIFEKLTYAAEVLVTLPTGNNNFGSNGTGVTVNGIANYDFTSALSAGFMLGVSSQTTSSNDGGKRYNSFNPDFLATWQFSEMCQVYVEVYGQTHTNPDERSGYNADGGIQYLITENIEVDIEYGVRLSGELGGFSHYYGVGGGIRF